MTATATANAVYYNADGTIELVELDSTDCVYAVIKTLTEGDLDALYTGETEYRVANHDVEVGDGDYFRRLATR